MDCGHQESLNLVAQKLRNPGWSGEEIGVSETPSRGNLLFRS